MTKPAKMLVMEFKMDIVRVSLWRKDSLFCFVFFNISPFHFPDRRILFYYFRTLLLKEL